MSRFTITILLHLLLSTSAFAQSHSTLTSPTPGSTLTGPSVTFTWTTGTNVVEYWLELGAGPGGFNLWSQSSGLNLSQFVTGLPTNGATVYARMWSRTNANGWEYADYTYTAFTAPALPAPTCDGNANDTARIQALLDRGGVITFPDGTCMVSGVYVPVSFTQLLGRGRTMIKRILGTYESLVSMPKKWGTITAGDMVTDVVIDGIMFDGNRAGLQPAGQPNYFGVQIIHGQRITLRNSIFQDQFHEAVSVGVGYQPVRDLAVQSNKIYRSQRNGIHIGYVDNGVVENNIIEDTPNSQWGLAAGNGIDVEVEGQGSYVRNLTIRNNTISRVMLPPTGTAGTGIALQPAYGSIQSVTISNNTIRNHQTGIWLDIGASPVTGVVETIDSINITNNTIFNDQNRTDGYGMAVLGASRVAISGNYINGIFGPGGQPYSLLLRGGHDHTVSNNIFLALPQPSRPFNLGIQDLPTGPTRNVLFQNNLYNRPSFGDISPNATGITQSGNVRF